MGVPVARAATEAWLQLGIGGTAKVAVQGFGGLLA
jgi:hypothetical protein